MFANSEFGNVQDLYIGMHRPTSFSGVGWQSCNVPLGNMICLQMDVV